MDQLLLPAPFLISTIVFAFSPGSGAFFMAAQTMSHGIRAGLSAALAFHLVSYLHILAAATGTALVLQNAPTLLSALRIMGAGYLIWMGVSQLLRTTSASEPARMSFRDSAIVELLNPKTALFYLAFLPQFITAQGGTDLFGGIFFLGAVANLIFSLSDAAWIAAGHLLRMQGKGQIRHRVEKLAGLVLIGIGFAVAVG